MEKVPCDYTDHYDDARIKRQPLPGVLGRIEKVTDYLTAERFALCFGGMEISIPQIMRDDHRIVRAMGRDAADAIGGELGPDRFGSAIGVDIPIGETEIKWNAVRRLRLQGHSRNQIVGIMRGHFKFCITVAHVGVLVRDLPAYQKKRVNREANDHAAREAAQ